MTTEHNKPQSSLHDSAQVTSGWGLKNGTSGYLVHEPLLRLFVFKKQYLVVETGSRPTWRPGPDSTAFVSMTSGGSAFAGKDGSGGPSSTAQFRCLGSLVDPWVGYCDGVDFRCSPLMS